MNFKKVAFASAFFLLLYLLPGNIFSDNVKKADTYYQKYDYKLALDIYEKIYKKKPTVEIAQKIANCYRFINDSENAERAYAQVISYPKADAINYKYYADALKQNGKFAQSKANYEIYGQKLPSQKEEAARLANACDVAKMWSENPDINVTLENQAALNSSNSDFSPVLYQNGIVFTSDRWFVKTKDAKRKDVFGWTGNPFLKLYIQADPSKSDITPLSNVLNADYHNGPAVFSADGNTVFFTRTEAPSEKKNKKLPVISKKIYYAVKKGNDWDTPVSINLNSVSYSIQHPALSPDGSILYFASDMPNGFGGMDIYAARKQSDGSWSKVTNCGPTINTAEDEVFPTVRKDGRFYFASKGHVGMGGLDIFTATGSYDAFSIAENLKTPINSTKDDFGIVFKEDLKGYFASNRKGGKGLDDIYSFSIAPVAPAEPLNVKTTTGTDSLLASPGNAKIELIFAVDGFVVDKLTKAPLPNTEIMLINKTTGERSKTISDSEGKFSFSLLPEMDYVINGNREKFYSKQEGKVSTAGLRESTIFNVRFELEKGEDAYIVRLENIYYDFNKWDIKPMAAKRLNKVVSFLNNVVASKIQLRSHTDSRGKAVYNKWLSQKRAQSAVNYLVKRGVGSSRLSAVGLGETELLNRCSNGVKCSIQEHRLNRRTEFKIIRMQI